MLYGLILNNSAKRMVKITNALRVHPEVTSGDMWGTGLDRWIEGYATALGMNREGAAIIRIAITDILDAIKNGRMLYTTVALETAILEAV